ncbi:MAG TPA: CBS domain-containing protein, partial [Kofleriaceae bacterium]|nr:CBS domain-containing protein [Kofleriaceae bacterium]
MQCRDLMRRPVELVSPAQSAVTAARAMREKNIGFLAVCDLAGHLVGVVTDRDLAVRVLGEERDPIATPVADIMSSQLVTCRPEDPLAQAEALMREHRKSRI